MKKPLIYLDTSVIGGCYDQEFSQWSNFKHIVRFDKIVKFNAVNIEQGYKPIAIYSPREVTRYGKD
jgi:hypothetical protein